MPGLVRIKDQHECISILLKEGMIHLILLGLSALNPYLHSIIVMPDTSPVVHKMLTIKFKILCINKEDLSEKLTYPIRLSGDSK